MRPKVARWAGHACQHHHATGPHCSSSSGVPGSTSILVYSMPVLLRYTWLVTLALYTRSSYRPAVYKDTKVLGIGHTRPTPGTMDPWGYYYCWPKGYQPVRPAATTSYCHTHSLVRYCTHDTRAAMTGSPWWSCLLGMPPWVCTGIQV